MSPCQWTWVWLRVSESEISATFRLLWLRKDFRLASLLFLPLSHNTALYNCFNGHFPSLSGLAGKMFGADFLQANTIPDTQVISQYTEGLLLNAQKLFILFSRCTVDCGAFSW